MGSPGGPGVENATAAFRKAATVTAASAERSGTAVVRITHNSEVWAGSTIRWDGDDLAVSSDAPLRLGKAGSAMLLVDGTLYAPDKEGGGWINNGSPENIDPDSGTTPDEYLAAVREDVGGVTLRRITEGMTGLATTELDDGSTIYSGTVAAGLIARESGFKGGQPIRVLPFGYVAHDEAATRPLPSTRPSRSGPTASSARSSSPGVRAPRRGRTPSHTAVLAPPRPWSRPRTRVL
jgi:hypothetical protein